jgi:DNA processing protein
MANPLFFGAMSDDYFNWFALKAIPQVGNVTYRRLLAHFGTPGSILAASRDELAAVSGISRAVVTGIPVADPGKEAEAQCRLLARSGAILVTINDLRYPALLKELADAPPFLFLKGELRPAGVTVALVGSRQATPYGISTAGRLAGELARQGAAVVSGLARGIDAAAHRGALDVGGQTIGVLGCGIDVVYPLENRRLYAEMAEKGAVISEFPPGTRPAAEHFPRRNRIISGLSQAVVVVEAAEKSGSLITAHYALEQGRDVFAVPGNVTQAGSRGANWLIKQGAKLVESAADILEDGPRRSTASSSVSVLPPPPSLAPAEAQLAEAPCQIDELVSRCRLTPGELSVMLLRLELRGLVQQLPGKYFALT